MVTTLKKRDIQKMKKTPGDTTKKVLNPKYGPNWSSGFRGIRGDRQTDRHTHPKKPLFWIRGVIKRVDPSKVGGRVFGVITILPLYYFVVRESKPGGVRTLPKTFSHFVAKFWIEMLIFL